MTPELLALRESVQDNDGFVPGGFLVFVVYERVPGIRLAEDTRLYPGLPLHTFFTKFDRAERDTIRDKFDEVYPVFAEMDYFPGHSWADHLVWDSSSKKLQVASALKQSFSLTWSGISSTSEGHTQSIEQFGQIPFTETES
ncbi:hypothetical protein N7452_007957 [Penicillium brevicompactum]|uniref:Uncharacterized protein n=1 Tax=Penicillium brevicompactum TaxID=5074 RepID=A0A9W9QG67_PENBR|nr:hypothetical protein N7452_007957 [Penicillium brevicompactum]